MLTSINDTATTNDFSRHNVERFGNDEPLKDIASDTNDIQEFVISYRISLSELTVSLIDSSPSEIAVLSFKNINAIGTWNTRQTTDSTVFVTVTSLQVDNMLPNAAFPVAVCPDDKTKLDSETVVPPPLLVIGLSLAPKHKSGIMVSAKCC